MRVELCVRAKGRGAENSFPGSRQRQRQETTLYIGGLKKVQYCRRVEYEGRVVKRSETGE